MFNNVLTTTLEAIILLDILGAIIYFVVSGIVRARKQPSPRSAVPVSVAPAGVSAYAGLSPVTPYLSSASSAAPPSRSGWFGLRDRFSPRAPSTSPSGPRDVESGHRKIGMILNSFKEDI